MQVDSAVGWWFFWLLVLTPATSWTVLLLTKATSLTVLLTPATSWAVLLSIPATSWSLLLIPTTSRYNTPFIWLWWKKKIKLGMFFWKFGPRTDFSEKKKLYPNIKGDCRLKIQHHCCIVSYRIKFLNYFKKQVFFYWRKKIRAFFIIFSIFQFYKPDRNPYRVRWRMETIKWKQYLWFFADLRPQSWFNLCSIIRSGTVPGTGTYASNSTIMWQEKRVFAGFSIWARHMVRT